MRIPLGNFGNAIAAPAPRVNIPQHTGGTGAQKLGDAGIKIATDMLSEQAAEQKKQQEEIDKSRAFKARVDFEDAVYNANDQVSEQLAQGKITREDAPTIYATQVKDARDKSLSGVSAEMAPNVGVMFDAITNRGAHLVGKTVDANRKQEQLGNLEYIRDNMAKQAVRPGADLQKINSDFEQVARVIGKEAGLPDDKLGKLIENFKDDNAFKGMVSAINTANNDGRTLRTLRDEIKKNRTFQGQELDPERSNAVLNTLNNRIQSIDHEAQAAEQRRLSLAQHAYNAAEHTISSGLTLSLEEKGALTKNVKGTLYEPFVSGMFKTETEIQDVLRKPISEQTSYLRDREARVKASGSLADMQNLNRLKRAVDENIKQITDAPLVQAVERDGAKLNPLSLEQMINPTDKTTVSELSNRLVELNRMEKAYGAPRKPLFPEEVAVGHSVMQTGTTEMRGKLLDTLRKGLNDDRAYRAAVQQISPDSPVTAVAGVIRGKSRDAVVSSGFLGMGRETISGKETSDLILEGESVLNKSRAQKGEEGKSKGFPMPPDKEFNAKFSSMVGTAFAQDESGYDRAKQSVRAWYAGKSIREGDFTGEVNSGRLDKAIKAVTGGVHNFNGLGSVLLPWGMDSSQFKDAVRENFQRAVKEYGLPQSTIDMLPHYGLMMNGDGRYLVTNGTRPIIGGNGRPLEVRIQTEYQSLADQVPK